MGNESIISLILGLRVAQGPILQEGLGVSMPVFAYAWAAVRCGSMYSPGRVEQAQISEWALLLLQGPGVGFTGVTGSVSLSSWSMVGSLAGVKQMGLAEEERFGAPIRK
jgi:hypothetical protein